MKDKRLHAIAGILIALMGMALVTFIPHEYMYNWDRAAVFGLVLIVGAGKEIVWDKLLRKGTADFYDFFATWVAGWVTCFAWLIGETIINAIF
jgi:hypothetical protein